MIIMTCPATKHPESSLVLSISGVMKNVFQLYGFLMFGSSRQATHKDAWAMNWKS